MKMILAMAVALGGMSVATAAWCKGDPAAGAKLYTANCVACHGADRAGMPGAFPALTDIGKRMAPAQIKEKISKAAGLWPPSPERAQPEKEHRPSHLAK